MKKLLGMIVMLAVLACCTAALAEGCCYESDDSPCNVVWQYDSAAKQHRRVCKNHVEDKEDPFSYMPLTEWEDCTLDEGGKCTVCGVDYVRDDTGEDEEIPDSEMDLMTLEMYLWYCEENGIPPVEVGASSGKLTLKLNGTFIDEYLYAMGVEVSESMYAKTTATLTLTEGTTYAATGEAIEPEVELVMSEYGPGKWMKYYEMIVVDNVAYKNNVEPGTATVEMTVRLVPDESYTLTASFTIEGSGVYCKYGSASSPCDIVWYVKEEARQHCRVCRNHVEDKEDMYSYVQVTELEDCTVDEETGECGVCGHDYVKEPDTDNYTPYMVEFYMMKSMENGTAPVVVTITGNQMVVEFEADYLDFLDACGIAYPSEMRTGTVYSIYTAEGSSFPYTGVAVEPVTVIDCSGKGPGVWLEEVGLMAFSGIAFKDNVGPGAASAYTELSVREGETYTLSTTFTIGDAADDRLPGDATGNDAVDISDAISMLSYCAGEGTVDLENADVNADGEVDLRDVLLILQYIAGWNVTLK